MRIDCGYEMACAVMLCGGVGWRLFGTCITVVIQSAREEVRQEKGKKRRERESDGERRQERREKRKRRE